MDKVYHIRSKTSKNIFQEIVNYICKKYIIHMKTIKLDGLYLINLDWSNLAYFLNIMEIWYDLILYVKKQDISTSFKKIYF